MGFGSRRGRRLGTYRWCGVFTAAVAKVMITQINSHVGHHIEGRILVPEGFLLVEGLEVVREVLGFVFEVRARLKGCCHLGCAGEKYDSRESCEFKSPYSANFVLSLVQTIWKTWAESLKLSFKPPPCWTRNRSCLLHIHINCDGIWLIT